MADIDYGQLAEDLGTNTADTLRNLANAAGNFACGLYRDSPATAVGPILDNPGSRLLNGLWDRLCSPRNILPPPPSQRGTGGQCLGVAYTGTVTGTIGERNAQGQVISAIPVDRFTGTIYGPIRVFQRSVSAGRLVGGYSYRTSTGEAAESAFIEVGNPSTPGYINNLAIALTRVDGQPDNCGNSAPQYDYYAPTVNNYNSPVTYGNNGFPITVNGAFILVRPDIDVEFRPEITVDVGGIKVQFDLGGANFYISPNGPPPTIPPGIDPRPLPPPEIPPRGEPCDVDLSPVYERFDDVDEMLEDIKECACEAETTESTQVLGSGRGGVFVLPDKTIFVRLLVTSPGSNLRLQVGEGSAPDVRFAGWYAFGKAGVLGERIPVSFLNNCFECPENSTHFGYSLNFNSSGTATAIYEEDVSAPP